jgi:hypothetical protein
VDCSGAVYLAAEVEYYFSLGVEEWCWGFWLDRGLRRGEIGRTNRHRGGSRMVRQSFCNLGVARRILVLHRWLLVDGAKRIDLYICPGGIDSFGV